MGLYEREANTFFKMRIFCTTFCVLPANHFPCIFCLFHKLPAHSGYFTFLPILSQTSNSTPSPLTDYHSNFERSHVVSHELAHLSSSPPEYFPITRFSFYSFIYAYIHSTNTITRNKLGNVIGTGKMAVKETV